MPAPTVEATSANIHELATEFALSEDTRARALELAGLTPAKEDWLRYLSLFMMTLGTALILAGITAFFAWNWADLGYLQKFALIQIGIAAAVLGAWRLGLDSPSGAACLFAGAFLVGVLLAVYGQVYQTGADPYGLFLSWAILVLPWAVIGRQQGIWLLVVLLLNLALIMYWTQVLYPPDGMWMVAQLIGPLAGLGMLLTDSNLSCAVFILNVTAVLCWEIGALRGAEWMQGHWFTRILAFIALAVVTVPTLLVIVAATFGVGMKLTLLSPLLLALAIASCLYYYQYRKQDLFILTCCTLAIIMVVTSTAVRWLLQDAGSLLILSMLLVAQVAGAAYWLRNVARRWEQAA